MNETCTCCESLEQIDPALIFPNPAQPRRTMDRDELEELAESIREWGILQPLLVRLGQRGGHTHYELIAGERRLRAGILAGLSRVPCRVLEAEEGDSAEIALVENLQRRDLNPFEEAAAIDAILSGHRITQEVLAERLSVSQPYIANKLRLLRLTEEERETILREGLTERHARALLRLTNSDLRRQVLKTVVRHGYTVAQTEEYVEKYLTRTPKPPKPQVKAAIKDLRLFYNSLDRALGIMRGAGMKTNCQKKVTEDGVEVTIFIHK